MDTYEARIIIHENGYELDRSKCILRLKDGAVEIVYDDDGKAVTWLGEEVEPGHYQVTSRATNGIGTLHTFSKGRRFVGEWAERHDGFAREGMWSIKW